MNKKINLTAIDTQITQIIHAVQYDTDRYLDCYFEDIDITGVSSARIYAKKPDGTEVYNDCVIQNGYITAPLTSQTLAVVGKVNCQLQLVIDGTLTSFAFTVIVDESLVSSSAIPSSNEYSALEEALAEVEDVVDGLPSKEDKANKVTEISADSTNVQYPSAKAVYDAISDIPIIEVDDALSDTSENPVQNKVVKNAVDGKISKSGDIMNGTLDMSKNQLYNVHKIGMANDDNNNVAEILPMSASSQIKIIGLVSPNGDNWAATKKYVDDADALNEKLANKVTSIDAQSTDTEYPSAKCVYDAIDAVPVITVDSALDAQSANPVENGVITTALGGKESTTNKVTAFSSPTDTEYPSAKLVDDSLALKEDLANKVTSISAASTDTEYPSAKCVYDLIGDINTILANLATP